MNDMIEQSNKAKLYDVVGIGVGPFNLGLAALLSAVNNFNALFLEKNANFSWHEGMLLDNSKLQVHYLKDLVSLVDPTNQFSFLQYLVEHGRIFQFLHRKDHIVSRHEFNNYFKWAANKINNVRFNSYVELIRYIDNKFILHTKNQQYEAKHVVIGTGITPNIPNGIVCSLSDNVFHNAQYKLYKEKLNFSNKKIAIIGGGQSGAEVFDDLLSLNNLPAKITWITERANFSSLEDTGFSNEFYSPSYSQYFYKLPPKQRSDKLTDLLFTSDGITSEFANLIYNKVYETKFVHNKNVDINFLLKHTVTAIQNDDGLNSIYMTNLDNSTVFHDKYDIVVLATGYKCIFPEFLKNLFPKIHSFEDLPLNQDYSVQWDYAGQNKIFIQNGYRHQFGVADSNLSLAPWRNASIVNSLLDKEYYKINNQTPIF